jgi:hypothetical protein
MNFLAVLTPASLQMNSRLCISLRAHSHREPYSDIPTALEDHFEGAFQRTCRSLSA